MHGGAAFGVHLLICDLAVHQLVHLSTASKLYPLRFCCDELSVLLLPEPLVMLGPGPSISRRTEIGSNWTGFVWVKILGPGPRMTRPGESYSAPGLS